MSVPKGVYLGKRGTGACQSEGLEDTGTSWLRWAGQATQTGHSFLNLQQLCSQTPSHRYLVIFQDHWGFFRKKPILFLVHFGFLLGVFVKHRRNQSSKSFQKESSPAAIHFPVKGVLVKKK